jgi:ectoine hydroxylase-related dioxygenase (phytanoyl-CoA dioxygenase family)
MDTTPETLKERYDKDGFVCVSNIFQHADIARCLGALGRVAARELGHAVVDVEAPDFADSVRHSPALQAKFYDDIRKEPEIFELSQYKKLVATADTLIDGDIGLFSKIVFRIDVPMEIRELAVWHQDFFYVRGSTACVTAWIPLQDTTYLNGCLSVMPGSHNLGPVEHDVIVLGKRHFPSKHLDREIRIIEMKKGDVLFFHSCLLHSGNMNLSNRIRYSVQARYTPIGAPTDEAMGQVIAL